MESLLIFILLPIFFTFIALTYHKQIFSHFHKLNKKLMVSIISLVSIGIIFISFNRTVEYRETTPSWEYYHDPFWFTFLIHSNTLNYLFIGLAGSLLLTIMIMKLNESLKRIKHQQR